MRLSHALRLNEPGKVFTAFIGAGGKTGAMFAVARQLPGKVLVCATTHLAEDQIHLGDRLIFVRDLEELEAALPGVAEGVTVFSGEVRSDGRAAGLDRALVNRLAGYAAEHRAALLVEADGSRRLPLKCPGDNEPATPETAKQVVLVAGMSGVGMPLDAAHVHRPELFAQYAGLKMGEPVSLEALAQVLTSPRGGLKNAVRSASYHVLLNQADDAQRQAQAKQLASMLPLEQFKSVIISALKPEGAPAAPEDEVLAVHEARAAIILAAGGSRRLGSPKALLTWKGEPFVRVLVKKARQAGLHPLVVTGYAADEVEAAVKDLRVETWRNPNWESGQSSSLQTGIRGLAGRASAALFLLVDQPQIPVELMRALADEHAATLAPVIAPLVEERRANPLLFDRVTFEDLMKVSGDQGGRAVLGRFSARYVPWLGGEILLDVDTPEDYQRLLLLEDELP